MAQTDLHIHSSLTAGGELSPRALAERCCEERLTLGGFDRPAAVSGVPECICAAHSSVCALCPGMNSTVAGGNRIFSRSASALTSPVRRCSRSSGRGTIRCSRLQPSRRFTRFTKQADWPCSVPPNEMDDTFPVAAFDGIAAYGSHSRADTARYHTLARRHGLVVTGGSGFLSEDKPPHRAGAVDFYGHEQQVAAAFLAAIHHLNEEKRSFHHDSICVHHYGFLGIHARPAGMLAKEAAKFKSKVFLHFGDKKADARRLIAIMGMGIKHGNTVRVEVEGEDETEAAAQIEAFFKANL